jgi:hypothetical protein
MFTNIIVIIIIIVDIFNKAMLIGEEMSSEIGREVKAVQWIAKLLPLRLNKFCIRSPVILITYGLFSAFNGFVLYKLDLILGGIFTVELCTCQLLLKFGLKAHLINS